MVTSAIFYLKNEYQNVDVNKSGPNNKYLLEFIGM